MPTAPGAICADCPKRATTGRYCGDHQVKNQRAEYRRLREYHRREHDPLRHLYKSQRWARVRRRVFLRDPLCCACGHRASTVVDHRVKARVWVEAHSGDEESFFDERNLQGLCKPDHDLKTRRGE
jgi:5-methylcytosine-specific restriction enzyme A